MVAHSLLSSLLLFLHLSLISTTNALTYRDEDPLIRQVVISESHYNLSAAKHQFLAFKRKYNKSYGTQQEDYYRFGVFMSNLRLAMRHQKLDPTAVHGITKFSDVTDSEFSTQSLDLDLDDKADLLNDANEAPILNTSNLPPEFDWGDNDAVTRVKDQGKFCRSSWAFSAVGALEGAHFLANDDLVDLSVQQLVDCDGGDSSPSFYAARIGLERDEDYPYKISGRGRCEYDKSQIVASASRFMSIPPRIRQYVANMVKYGPPSVEEFRAQPFAAGGY
ncbi:Cysteine proteinase [Melia azedarach]|uniref:Cysteine proteinase n=1 Tax=Melia azedarach TaxID=155640 RepID=A0ACC1WUE3_MELAZ|nr:Cysteine proteinase [Melia azedarach]